MAAFKVPVDAPDSPLRLRRLSARSLLFFVFFCLPVFLLGPAEDQKQWILPSSQLADARKTSRQRTILSPATSEEEIYARGSSGEESEEEQPSRRRRTRSSSSTRRSGVYEWPVESVEQPQQQPQEPEEAKEKAFADQGEEEELVRSTIAGVPGAGAPPAEGVFQLLRQLFSAQAPSRAEQMAPLAKLICQWFVKGRFETQTETKIIVVLASARKVRSGVPTKLLRLGRKRESETPRTDLPLSQEGEVQAKAMDLKLYSLIQQIHSCEKEETKRPFASFCVEAFVASPYTSSVQTASLATGASGKWLLCKSPKEKVSRTTRVTWSLEPLIKEKSKSAASAGTESTALQAKLLELHGKGGMESAALDFGLIPPENAWWLPYSDEQLKDMLRRSAAQGRTPSSSSSGSSSSSSSSGSSGSSPFIVGNASAWPFSMGATSLRDTSMMLQSPFQNRSIPPPNSPLAKESAETLQLRAEVVIRAICTARNFSSGLLVTHSHFASALLGVAKVKSGDVHAAVVSCEEGRGQLTTLGAPSPRVSYEGAERKSSSSSEISDTEA